MKDLSYALEMAHAAGLEVEGAELAMRRLRAAEAQGFGEQYHPVVLKVIDREER
jgi:3-hydroxyisobutyrate dehydrogenase-like beta-hydroxyacid dehydrogenase